MRTEEFSNEFSVLLNSFGVTPNIILDEYEKSVFLTEAQEQLIIDAYVGRDPKFQDSFEETEELRNYLAPLVVIKTLSEDDQYTDKPGITSYSAIFPKSKSIWFITYEAVTLDDPKLGCLSGSTVQVVPVAQDEIHRTLNNPFRGPGKNRVLRVNSNYDTLELISKYHISEYKIGYLEKPSPIVLVDLPDGLTIDDYRYKMSCLLPESLHRTILNRAVQLAIAAKTQLNSKS